MNLRLGAVLDFLVIPSLSSAFSALLFTSFLVFPLLEFAGFVEFAGDDLKNNKIVPCLEPVLLVVSPAAGCFMYPYDWNEVIRGEPCIRSVIQAASS